MNFGLRISEGGIWMERVAENCVLTLLAQPNGTGALWGDPGPASQEVSGVSKNDTRSS
jgi:hypothetical protein